MIKEKTNKKKQISKMHDEYYISKNKGCGFLFILLIPLLAIPIIADEIKFQFKSPSFSGIGTSAHYLTIENQEYTRREALEAEIKALQEELERDAENTTLARFLRNFESRVYAQLSRQLVEQLFGDNPAQNGEFTLFDNLITWTTDGVTITMTIFNETTGETTTITIPIGDFGF
tara:strand:- start:1055 stop:1576 length:522 start_codon:yes stop_codon:yes gene_type:complete